MRTALPSVIATWMIVRKVVVAALGPDVARIDPILGERARAVGILGEQQMSVVVKVADHGNVDVLDDGGDGARGFIGVHRHAAPARLPAACSARTCAAVAAASAVSVLVIDWTTIGWALPTSTPPTLTVTVGVGYSRPEI